MNSKAKTGIVRLLEIAGRKKGWLIVSMFLSVCSSIAQIVPYIAIYKILIELSSSASHPELIDSDYIWHWAWISFGSIVVYAILMYVATILSHIAAFNILYELRVAILKKLVKLPLGFFSKKSSGEIKKIVSEDVDRVELFVAHHIPDVTSATVFPLVVIAWLFFADWRLALVVLFVFIVAIGLQATMTLGKGKRQQRIDDYHQALGQMNSSIVEYVRGMQVVKIFNRSIDAFHRLKFDIFKYRDTAIGITKSYAFSYTAFLTILSSTLLFLIPVSVFILVKSTSYSGYLPTVFLFLVLGAGLFFPMLKLMYMSSIMGQNTAGVMLVDNILNKEEMPEPIQPEKMDGSNITFENVFFAYEDKLVLDNVSFEVPQGSVTALVGASGAGKSTIALLTARFWDVKDGSIKIGGTDVRSIPFESLMDNIAFVFQENMLFFDTIEENIRMGNKTATMEEVISAAKIAQCDEFIENLEHGYQTLVGEGGTYLSGGEQQRIGLARAILKDAPIILLDEATAYADPENEGKILDSFSHLVKNKTVMVIAHRLSTIITADQILVIDDGEIAERGTHESLLELDNIYAQMWRTYCRAREWKLSRN